MNKGPVKGDISQLEVYADHLRDDIDVNDIELDKYILKDKVWFAFLMTEKRY